jgi:hypothetical protein
MKYALTCHCCLYACLSILILEIYKILVCVSAKSKDEAYKLIIHYENEVENKMLMLISYSLLQNLWGRSYSFHQ